MRRVKAATIEHRQAAFFPHSKDIYDGISDHKVFVAGGSRGIGAAIVRRFAAAGATVVFTYAASADAANRLAAETGAQALRADAGERDELIAAIR